MRRVPLLLQASLKLYGIYGHVLFLLRFGFESGRDHVRAEPSANTSQQIYDIGGYAESILQ
jgi:hypothetical protein